MFDFSNELCPMPWQNSVHDNAWVFCARHLLFIRKSCNELRFCTIFNRNICTKKKRHYKKNEFLKEDVRFVHVYWGLYVCSFYQLIDVKDHQQDYLHNNVILNEKDIALFFYWSILSWIKVIDCQSRIIHLLFWQFSLVFLITFPRIFLS